MRNINEIIVSKATVNMLDKANNNIVFSDSEIILNEISYEYLEKHILKLFRNDDARTARFDGEQNIVKSICSEIFEDHNTFISSTKKLAQYFFKCIANDEQEASGDFVACLIDTQAGIHLVLMKLDFTETYSHYLKNFDDKSVINVAMNKTGLPGLGQRVSKAVIIKQPKEGEEFQLLVIDKAWDSTFIHSFLRCEFVRDKLENTKILHTISERFARRAFKDDAQGAETFRKSIAEELISAESFDIDQVAKECLQDEVRVNEFKAALVNEGIIENDVRIDRTWAEKKLQRKRLKIDKSIELYIDTDAYKDKDKFQIKRNGDGTIDIVLKNVRNYIEK